MIYVSSDWHGWPLEKILNLLQQAEFGNGTGPGTADDQIGGTIGGSHVANEVGYMKHRQFTCLGYGGAGFINVYLACLPNKLDSR